ncbi:MAG: hypothetical protein WDA25_05945 [Paracoccaceae bacterium]
MSGRPRNTARRYIVNAGSSLATTLIRMSFLVWINQYLLRRIAPEEYALIPVVMALMVVIELFPMVFLRGLSRFMVEADARDDAEGLARIVSSMFPLLLAVAMVLLAGGIWAAVNIDTLLSVAPEYRRDAQIMLILLIGTLSITVATTPFSVGLYVRMRFVAQNVILLGSELVRIGLLLVLLFGVSTKALWVVVATVTGNLINIAALIAYTLHILPHARVRLSLISGATVRLVLGFSLWTLVQGFNNLVLRAAPALLLNRFSTATDVAAFHVGNLADVQIRKLVAAAAAPATPALTTIYATEGESALQVFYYRGGRYYLWVTLFLLPPLLVFAQELMVLYVGSRYAAAGMVMVLTLAPYPFHWASGMFYQIAYAVGRIRAFNIYSLGLGAASLAGMWYFVVIRDMGAIGAALGLGAAAALVHLLIIWPAGLWLVKGRWRDFGRRTLLPGMVPFAAAVGACVLYGQAVPVDSWLRFFAGCGISAVVYVAALALCTEAEDKALLGRGYARLKAVLGRGERAP